MYTVSLRLPSMFLLSDSAVGLVRTLPVGCSVWDLPETPSLGKLVEPQDVSFFSGLGCVAMAFGCRLAWKNRKEFHPLF